MNAAETELVPVPSQKRWFCIGFSAVIVTIGCFLLIESVRSKDEGQGFYGIPITVFGIFCLVHFFRKTHEVAMTEAGRAANAVREAVAAGRKERMENAVTRFFLWAVLFVVVIFWVDPLSDLLRNRIGVYPIGCEATPIIVGKCAAKNERAGLEVKFIVHVDQQLVIRMVEGHEPVKLYNCVVADVNDWTCTTEPQKDWQIVLMKDGRYDPSALGVTGVRYASRLEYLWTKYKHILGPGFARF
jgi:hypothetical protein